MTATLELDNQTNADLMNVTLETTLPEGLYSENTMRTYDKIAAGQKIIHSFTIQAGEKSSVVPVSLSSIPVSYTHLMPPSALLPSNLTV